MSEFDDYNAQLEQQEAAETWAEAIINMMGDHMDPEHKSFVKEGLQAILTGPPRMPLPRQPMLFIAPEIPDATFVHNAPDGSVIIYDWHHIAGKSSHIVREPDGTVTLYNGNDVWLTLGTTASAIFWKWIVALRNSRVQGPVDAEFASEENSSI